MNTLALVHEPDLTAIADSLIADLLAELATAAELHPIPIPLTDPSVMAGEYAPEVVKRRIHRRARVIQVAMTRVKIRLDGAGVR